MKHVVDERRCPNCQHDTSTWQQPCPGCGRTPANTLAGRQLLQRQQRRLWAIRAIPPLVFMVAVAARLIADRWDAQRQGAGAPRSASRARADGSHASSVDQADESGAQDSQPVAAGAATPIAETFDLAAYQGKYVILDFWATWCGPCRRQLPALKRFYQDIERESGVVLVSISLDRDRRSLERFVRKEQMRWPQVIQTDGFRSALARRYQVGGIPHMVLIGPDGKTVLSHASLPLVRRALQPHLAQPASAQQNTAGTGTLRGALEYDGRPLADATAAQPRFWFRNEDHNTVPHFDVSVSGSAYEVRDMPLGTYGMDISVDANAENPPGYPGDLTSWEGGVNVTQAGEMVVRNIHFARLIRLLEPVDNIRRLARSADDPPPAYPSPLRFRWEAVPGATAYKCAVDKVSPTASAAYAPAVSEGVEEPAWSVELPPSEHDGYYRLTISAYHGRERIGSLEMHGANYRAWDFQFRIAPASSE